MTYKNLKRYIDLNDKENNFDLARIFVKSKVIFIVGDHRSNVASMLSSVLSACEISHSRYIGLAHLELKDRFINNGESISVDSLCASAHKLKRNTQGKISSDDLLLALSLSLLGGNYLLIEMSEEHYQSALKRIGFTPFALILCSKNDESNAKFIAQAPKSTHICALSEKKSYDFCSKSDDNGRKIAFVSENKLTFKSANLLGTDFYHFNYLYHAPIIDQRNLLSAGLVIETASILFNAPRPYIYKGISDAALPCDLKIASISPTIILSVGDGNFILPKGFDFERVTNVVPNPPITNNTVFYGDIDYIEKIKSIIKNAVQE